MSLCSSKHEIVIVRGTTNPFGISIMDEEIGEPYTLEPGQVLVFGLKKRERDEACILVKKILNTLDGEYYLELTPEDTANIPPGHYFYDISLQDGEENFYSVIRISPFVILPNITKLGDGS